MKNVFKKHVILTIFLIIVASTYGQGIPNGSFEELEYDKYGKFVPQFWKQTRTLSCYQNGHATDSAYEGDWFVVIGTVLVPTGFYDSSATAFSTRFKLSSLPSELSAHYKYYPNAENEKFLAKVTLFKRTSPNNLVDTIAVGSFEPVVSEWTTKWTPLKFKIEYRKEETPDSAEVIFYSSQRSVYTSQTSLVLDDVKFSDSLRALSIGDKVVFQPVNKVTVYPNPATNQLFVKINEPNSKNYTLKIYDLLGRELINKQFTGENNPEFEINTSLLATGVYVLDVKSEDKTIDISSKITIAKP